MLTCTYSAAEQRDNEDTHSLTFGCEDLLYFSDREGPYILYDKIPCEKPSSLSIAEKAMIDDFIENNKVMVLEDAKVFMIQTVGMDRKYPFVALPDYDERIRVIKKAKLIAEKDPLRYQKFFDKINKNEVLYYAAAEVVNASEAERAQIKIKELELKREVTLQKKLKQETIQVERFKRLNSQEKSRKKEEMLRKKRIKEQVLKNIKKEEAMDKEFEETITPKEDKIKNNNDVEVLSSSFFGLIFNRIFGKI